MLSLRLQTFRRDHDLVINRAFYREDVDPAERHRCDACDTMRVTGTLFRIYCTRCKKWFKVAQHCYFALNVETMPTEMRQEARERWEKDD